MGGLYGGALVDAFDRRLVALWTAGGLWICSGALVLQAVLDLESLGLLYAPSAVQSGMFAVNNPARHAIVPRLLPTLHGSRGVPGLRSVTEGLRFLKGAANVRMTFFLDLCAMVLAQPPALFPALALTVYSGNASTLGLLQAAPGCSAKPQPSCGVALRVHSQR